MPILSMEYVNITMFPTELVMELDLQSRLSKTNRMNRTSLACTPCRISWCYFSHIAKNQICIINVSNHQHLDVKMSYRILGNLEELIIKFRFLDTLMQSPVSCPKYENRSSLQNHRKKAWIIILVLANWRILSVR